MSIRNLSSILEGCVEAAPDRRAYTFLAEGREEGRVLTYADLYRLAGKCAWWLREHVKAGDRVLLVQENSLDFLVGFLGCVFAGAVAVPVPPLDPSRVKRTLPRVRAVIADCDAAAVLASVRIRGQVKDAFASERDLQHLPWIVTDDLDDVPHLGPQGAGASDLAVLQYTSG